MSLVDYLFVNWDVCYCRINSSYNSRVGRSESPKETFSDKNGVDLTCGGGAPVLDAAGDIFGNKRFQSPRHSGIYQHSGGKYYFSHRFYDADNNGDPPLAIWNLDRVNNWTVLNTQEKTIL